MLSPQRKDYRDRYMSGLKPSHRLGFSRFRDSGILAPFSLDTSDFTEPNRSVCQSRFRFQANLIYRLSFSSKGHWLLRDSETPFSGWAVAAVKRSGHRHGVDPVDVYGSLFFHIKAEFIKFANRFRDFDISIALTQVDACRLPGAIMKGGLPPFHEFCFDRIDTSNMADFTTIPRILDDWSLLLNRRTSMHRCL